jgi:glycosyltransferase involved in cell wall biosynthesis
MVSKVWFVLDVRFPTEKAYGVTTTYTASAVNALNDFSAVVVTPTLDPSLISMVPVNHMPMPMQRLYRILLRQNTMISKIAFVLWKTLYAMRIRKVFNRKDDVIWTRDLQITLMLALLGFRVVCEVHRTPSSYLTLAMKFLSNFDTVTIAFITERLAQKLNYKGKFVIAPMAISERDLLVREKVRRRDKREFIVGYLGSTSSSGNTISFRPILKAAENYLQSNTQVQFCLVGPTPEELKVEGEIPENVHVMGRISRDDVIQVIDEFDLGIILYPDSFYFEDSFPIKIVEYAARRIPIIASDTKAHRYILGDDKCLFFDLQSIESLEQSIDKVLQNKVAAAEMTNNAYKWVEKLTYEERVKKVLNIS